MLFTLFPISSHRVLKQSVLKDQEATKLIFIVSSSTLSKISFLNYECKAAESMMNTSPVRCHGHLISTKMPSFTCQCLPIIQTNVKAVEKAKVLL